jgi:hypothetical protein
VSRLILEALQEISRKEWQHHGSLLLAEVGRGLILGPATTPHKQKSTAETGGNMPRARVPIVERRMAAVAGQPQLPLS